MDDELERKAISGDYQAILTLIEMDEEILYRIAYKYLKNEQDSLDVMQEFTYKALKKCQSVRQPQFVRTWFVRVLINCCNDHLKKKKSYIPLSENALSYTPSYEELYTLVSQLPLSDQQIVYAKYYQQLSNKEIATMQNIPEGTVKSKVHHILKRLRKIAGVKEDWY